MNHYIDILIKPDAEMRENVLLNKVYTKFHKALCLLKSTEIGISFPRYKVILGDVIRIHGTENALAELQAMNWLGGLSGYCDINSVQVVPQDVVYRTISRKQTNMSEAKLRRLIERDTIPAENIKVYKAKMFQQGLDNPYFELESASNKHKYRRYLVFGKLNQSIASGQFDYFGLSKTATVPWF